MLCLVSPADISGNLFVRLVIAVRLGKFILDTCDYI